MWGDHRRSRAACGPAVAKMGLKVQRGARCVADFLEPLKANFADLPF